MLRVRRKLSIFYITLTEFFYPIFRCAVHVNVNVYLLYFKTRTDSPTVSQSHHVQNKKTCIHSTEVWLADAQRRGEPQL